MDPTAVACHKSQSLWNGRWGTHNGGHPWEESLCKRFTWWPSHHFYSWLVKIIPCDLSDDKHDPQHCILEVNGIQSSIYRMLTNYPTSLSIHFLTRRSSPVMSLIVYMILVADSCASRITPTIVTWKQNNGSLAEHLLSRDNWNDSLTVNKTQTITFDALHF